jgi:hypothetical protein
MNYESEETRPRVGLLWRGDPATAETPTPQNNRLYPLFKAFADLNVIAEPVIYSDEMVNEIRGRLIRFDGVLVWVDPITDGHDRSKLDPMLRDVAVHGVLVSAHPDVIQTMGTKEVLFRTRHFGWGGDTHLYPSAREFEVQFPERLKSSGIRILKQRRGNGGIGTWKIQLANSEAGDALVQVQEARRNGPVEKMRLSAFMRRCAQYFSADGGLIDQQFQPRVAEGTIRCYLVQNRVVGFSTQMPRAPGDFAMAREKTMYENSEPKFARLKTEMESEWVPALQQLFGLDTNSLPAVWDADFLYGPKSQSGDDTYVLGEINVSAVLPFPPSAVNAIAQAALTRMLAVRSSRAARDV